MNVWCEVDCLDDKRTRIVKTLWVQIEMPVLMPIGSIIYMPSPKDWEPICGSLMCRVKGYTLIGQQIECKAEPVGMVFDADDTFEDMLAVGYLSEEPQELKDAFVTTQR